MILASILIFFLSLIAMRDIARKYHREGETDISVDEFIARAGLDDIIRMRHFSLSAWSALGLMTICSAMRVT